jgi:hypothetical protein
MLFKFETQKGKLIKEINSSNKDDAKMKYKELFKNGEVNVPINTLKVIDVSKEIKLSEEIDQIKSIMHKIYNEFGVEIKALNYPSSVDEARKMYKKLQDKLNLITRTSDKLVLFLYKSVHLNENIFNYLSKID